MKYFILITPFLLLSGCADKPVKQIPVSAWGGTYIFNYSQSATPTPYENLDKAASKTTIVVTNPTYREDDSDLSIPDYSKVGRGLSTSMGMDMNKILLSKGLKTSGPFLSHDDMTLTDLNNASLTLAPKVVLNIRIFYLNSNGSIESSPGPSSSSNSEIQPRGKHSRRSSSSSSHTTGGNRQFMLKVSGYVSFVIKDPLSEKKLWIKKIDLDEMVVSGQEVRSKNSLDYDGKPDALADAIKQMYPTIMDYFVKNTDPHEILALIKQTKKSRKKKNE